MGGGNTQDLRGKNDIECINPPGSNMEGKEDTVWWACSSVRGTRRTWSSSPSFRRQKLWQTNFSKTETVKTPPSDLPSSASIHPAPCPEARIASAPNQYIEGWLIDNTIDRMILLMIRHVQKSCDWSIMTFPPFITPLRTFLSLDRKQAAGSPKSTYCKSQTKNSHYELVTDTITGEIQSRRDGELIRSLISVFNWDNVHFNMIDRHLTILSGPDSWTFQFDLEINRK